MNARLALRFALGTRDGRVRLALTALTAGLAVALLLLAVAVPGALARRGERAADRVPQTFEVDAQHRALVSQVAFTVDGVNVSGVLLSPRGARFRLPPGIDALPSAGTMAASPALAALLASGDAPVVSARLPYRIDGVVGDAGLLGPDDLRFVVVEPRLSADADGTAAITGWGDGSVPRPLDDGIALLLVVGVVVLLLPIGVVVVLSGRFGAERRERRLAALRLAGLAGRDVVALLALEALLAAAAAALAGVLLFLALRQLLAVVTVASLSVFPADAVPPAPAAAAILLLVPATVVLAAVSGLRGVVVEPLGVARRSRTAPRMVLWRLVPLGAGAGLLAVAAATASNGRPGALPLVGTGVALLLVGTLAMLPWLVERSAAVLPGDAVAWRLALGRLGEHGAASVRIVGVVAVTLAGAIALQLLFAGLAASYGSVDATAVPSVRIRSVPQRDAAAAASALPRGTTTLVELDLAVRGKEGYFAPVLVGDCAALGRIAVVAGCRDGAVYRTAGDGPAGPGARLDLGGATWRVPTFRAAPAGLLPDGSSATGTLLVTPSAIRLDGTEPVSVIGSTSADRLARLVAAATRVDPTSELSRADPGADARRFDAVRRGLTVALALVLALVGALLLTAAFDQLRGRRAALAALAAIGLRRRTMAASILAEAAVPVAVGAVVAVAAGGGLGVVLLRLLNRAPALDGLLLVDVGLAVAVPLLLAAAGLPATLRLMRPEGLRAE